MSEIPSDLAADEKIGRRILESNKAKSPINPRLFKEKDHKTPISVDRMSCAERQVLSELGREQANVKGKSAFYGWATLSVASAQENRRTVIPSPSPKTHDMPANPYHADIHLNISDKDKDSIQEKWTHHTEELAAKSSFEPA